MPNTGERREISKRVNAKEAETVQESKKLVSRTKQLETSIDARNKARLGATKKQQKGPKPLSPG